jgi:hypothetical protein
LWEILCGLGEKGVGILRGKKTDFCALNIEMLLPYDRWPQDHQKHQNDQDNENRQNPASGLPGFPEFLTFLI